MTTESPFGLFMRSMPPSKNFSATAQEDADGGVLISLVGYLEGESANALTGPLIMLVNQWKGEPLLVIDFARLEYISSLGIGTITMAAATARKQGISVSLRNLRPSVRHVFDLLGMSSFIPIEADHA
jgi:anti-anti-sigma factor